MNTLKTLMNVGKNLSNEYTVPVYTTVSKEKDFEVRIYETTKYITIKYYTIHSEIDGSKKLNQPSVSSEERPNNDIMGKVWKLMKYTQGENDKKTKMKFHMPVFVHVETVSSRVGGGAKEIEVKIMIALPPEYQGGLNLEPPEPNDKEITFETMESFKCYVKTFGGFAEDSTFNNQTLILREILKKSNDESIDVDENKCICISYDPPFKLVNRRNEVMVIQKQIKK